MRQQPAPSRAPEEQRVLPRAELSRWVESIGIVQGMSPGVHRALYAPRFEASLLLRWSESDGAVANVIGPSTRARQRTFRAPSYYVRLVLRAGRAQPLLGVPLHELVDRIVPIDELWGSAGRALRDSLGPANVTGMIERVESALLARLGSAEPLAGSALLERAMTKVAEGDETRLAELSRQLGVSDRHLRRIFREGLGMSPKRYARLARLRRVLVHAGSEPWATLAQQAGFHDQSHMIREFRDLMQLTPEAYRESVRGLFERTKVARNF